MSENIIVEAGPVYQAIETKYHGPTNSRGSRISARSQAGRIFVHYDHALSIEANHHAACLALATKLGWTGRWVGGARADGCGNVYTSTRIAK